MSARFGLRFAQQSARQSPSFTTRTPFQFRNSIFRRWQGTATNPAVEGAPTQSAWQRLLTSEVGIKTVHFWYDMDTISRPIMLLARQHPGPCRDGMLIGSVSFYRAPVMKWGVVLAGATDFLRPAEKLSLTQNLALMATGSIWTRWCFVIKPKNMLYVLPFSKRRKLCGQGSHSA
jgi:hypothetical protein